MNPPPGAPRSIALRTSWRVSPVVPLIRTFQPLGFIVFGRQTPGLFRDDKIGAVNLAVKLNAVFLVAFGNLGASSLGQGQHGADLVAHECFSTDNPFNRIAVHGIKAEWYFIYRFVRNRIPNSFFSVHWYQF